MNYKLYGIAASAAQDSTGWYPAGITENGVYTPRSEFKSGVNEGKSELCKEIDGIYETLEKEYSEETDKVAELLSEGILFIFYRRSENKVILSLNMNDTFAWACADCEDIEKDKLNIIYDLYKKFSYHGPIAYTAKIRKMDPIKPRITEQYKEAIKYLEETNEFN